MPKHLEILLTGFQFEKLYRYQTVATRKQKQNANDEKRIVGKTPLNIFLLMPNSHWLGCRRSLQVYSNKDEAVPIKTQDKQSFSNG